MARLSKRQRAARRTERERQRQLERQRRSRAAKKGWASRREQEALTPLLERLLQLQAEGASASVIKRAHGKWYARKLDTIDVLGESAYEKIVRRLGEVLHVDNIDAYVES